MHFVSFRRDDGDTFRRPTQLFSAGAYVWETLEFHLW